MSQPPRKKRCLNSKKERGRKDFGSPLSKIISHQRNKLPSSTVSGGGIRFRSAYSRNDVRSPAFESMSFLLRWFSVPVFTVRCQEATCFDVDYHIARSFVFRRWLSRHQQRTRHHDLLVFGRNFFSFDSLLGISLAHCLSYCCDSVPCVIVLEFWGSVGTIARSAPHTLQRNFQFKSRQKELAQGWGQGTSSSNLLGCQFLLCKRNFSLNPCGGEHQ